MYHAYTPVPLRPPDDCSPRRELFRPYPSARNYDSYICRSLRFFLLCDGRLSPPYQPYSIIEVVCNGCVLLSPPLAWHSGRFSYTESSPVASPQTGNSLESASNVSPADGRLR